jgi:hypothetical protein
MVKQALLTLVVILSASAAMGAEVIGGRTASRWKAQPGWTPARLASQFNLEANGDWLAFSAGGEGKQMTWTLAPEPAELAGEPRYLVLRYKASNVSTTSGEMFLSMQSGTDQWLRLFTTKEMIADGQEHTLAVDLHSYQTPAPVEKFLLRIGPVQGDKATLLAKMQFQDELPGGVSPVVCKWPKEKRVRLDFEEAKWTPSPNWTPRPPVRHEMKPGRAGTIFEMEGAMTSMRWSSRLSKPLSFTETPFVALRYRAKGDFGPFGYVFYLGTSGKDPKTRSVYAMRPGDVIADGQWHVYTTKLDSKETPSGTVAVGIDCLSPEAKIELDYIEFSSRPVAVPLADTVQFAKRGESWPAGREGFSTLPLLRPKRSNPLLLPRLGIGSWFDAREIAVEGIPFQVAETPDTMPSTGVIDEERLEVPLAGQVNEVLLLLAACFPNTEKFGASWNSESPLRSLDEPERVALGLVYADGTVDEMLPVNAAEGRYGITRQFGLYSVRPAAGKQPVKLVVHDRLRNGCFGIVGVTVNRGQPRIAEPDLALPWYPEVKKARPAEAKLTFAIQNGLTWEAIRSPMFGRDLKLTGEPVFRLKLADRELTSKQFKVDGSDGSGKQQTIRASFDEQDLALRAVLDVTQEADGTQLALKLTNASGKPVTGTLFFPTVSKLSIGDVGSTWYFCARRGGVIHHLPRQFRDEIGEGHPLAVDGFFNPSVGAGVCFLPRDLEGAFRWYSVGKDASGGNYALEFLPQTAKPGDGWQSVPVVVAAVAGDWRDQLAVYRRGVKTWYKPLAERKDWFRRLWSFPSYGPTQPDSTPLDERLDFVALANRRNQRIPGSTDYMHLFGWAISKEYGHWGAYDHYHQFGSKDRFREAVRRCQAAAIPVGLYLDGYLVSTQSDKPSKADVEKWAVRGPKGNMLYHTSYDAHSMCPYVAEWRKHLVEAYRRVADEIQPDGMYIDEFGKCMTERTCYNPDHGHPVPMGMCAGEWLLTKEVRQAVPAKIATYCEFVPADVATQYLDGAYGHVSLNNHREGYGTVAPHFVNLHRFALPDFKTFELIYYVPLRNGNWFLLKYPFFNGDGYYLTGAELDGYDEHSRAFLTRAFKILHEHPEAFTATDVEPLVRTEQPGLFANRFSAAKETIWTLHNTNYRTVRGPLLTVPHVAGAEYFDLWNDRPLAATIEGDQAKLPIELGPRAVGCIVQRRASK